MFTMTKCLQLSKLGIAIGLGITSLTGKQKLNRHRYQWHDTSVKLQHACSRTRTPNWGYSRKHCHNTFWKHPTSDQQNIIHPAHYQLTWAMPKHIYNHISPTQVWSRDHPRTITIQNIFLMYNRTSKCTSVFLYTLVHFGGYWTWPHLGLTNVFVNVWRHSRRELVVCWVKYFLLVGSLVPPKRTSV